MDHPRSRRRTPPKSTLFCRRCDHESPIGGEWHVRDGDALVYECPRCKTAVTVRRLSRETT